MRPADLESARDVLALSKSELAAAVGVTPAAVNYWLSGKRPIPNWLPLALIALELGYVLESYDIAAGLRRSAKANKGLRLNASQVSRLFYLLEDLDEERVVRAIAARF